MSWKIFKQQNNPYIVPKRRFSQELNYTGSLISIKNSKEKIFCCWQVQNKTKEPCIDQTLQIVKIAKLGYQWKLTFRQLFYNEIRNKFTNVQTFFRDIFTMIFTKL